MNPRFLLLLGFFAGMVSMGRVWADEAAPRIRPPEELDELYGPIALYPDALIAMILPASTVPSDVVMAARYLNANGDMTKIDDQGWDDSVADLMHYPDVIRWMDENLAWTKQAGESFLAQQEDVMDSIQRLRTRARAAGTLVNNSQQQVVMDGHYISIIPTRPDVIYVPSYDPDVVYVSRLDLLYPDSFLSFGMGYATGFWLGYDMDWERRRIWTIDPGDRERYWRERRDWRRPYYPGRPGYGNNHFHQQLWRPLVRSPRSPAPRPSGNNWTRSQIQRPMPYPNGGPGPGPDSYRGGPDGRFDNRDRNSNNPGQPSGRSEVGPKPATVVVPAGPSSRSSPAMPNAATRPTQPPSTQNQRGRDDRDSRSHDRSERTANPNSQGRVTPAQPAPQPQPQSQIQPSTRPTARFHSRPTYPTTQPRMPAPSAHSQQEAAYSRRYYAERPQQSAQHWTTADRDARDRRDTRQ